MPPAPRLVLAAAALAGTLCPLAAALGHAAAAAAAAAPPPGRPTGGGARAAPGAPRLRRQLQSSGEQPGAAPGSVRRSYEGYAVVRATPEAEGQPRLLTDEALTRAGLLVDLWSEPRGAGKPVDLMARGPDVDKVTEYLRASGIPFTMMINDVRQAIEASHTALTAAVGPAQGMRGMLDFALDQYHTFGDITAWLDAVAALKPALARAVVIGDTYENRTVKGIKIAAHDGRPALVITCGLHAREWISPASCLYVIDTLVSGYGVRPEVTAMVDAFEWHIVPVTNADGYVYTWTDDRLWRKTRRPQRASCVGADPNRNFDDHWCLNPYERICNSQTFCGDAPLSEPCVRNLAQYLTGLKDRGTDIQGFVDIHAYSQLWMWPYGWTSSTHTQDHQVQATCAAATAAAILATHGTEFQVGPIASTVYEAGGSAVDWAYTALGVKFAYAAELRDHGRWGFLLPAEEIAPSGEELLAGLAALASCIVRTQAGQPQGHGNP